MRSYIMQKNNFFEVFNFSRKRETILYVFANAHLSHLLILRIDF